MKKVAIITNIPAPYSVDLYNAIEELAPDIELSVVFSAMARENRQWTIDRTKLKNIYSLNSYIIKRTDGDYIRYIHIPKGAWKTLDKIDPEVLLVYEYNITSLISLFWAKIKNRKFIHITEGTLWSEINIGFFQKILRHLILRNADFCIACSSKSREKLIKWNVPKEKIQVILLTSDIKKYKESRNKHDIMNNHRLLYVGSIEKRKGIDLLIKAIKNIPNSERITLNIVGNGDAAFIDSILELIKKEEIKANIVFSGFLEGEELIKAYQSADLFVFPSRSDCYGLVLVEAYCAGLPIVTSIYADGAYDVVKEGVNGKFVNPYDSTEFSSAMSEVLNRDIYKINASNMSVRKFEINTEAKGFIDIIRKYVRN